MLDRESKVANLGPTAFAEEDIFGFDIKMEAGILSWRTNAPPNRSLVRMPKGTWQARNTGGFMG
jgi:hypothetical protein